MNDQSAWRKSSHSGQDNGDCVEVYGRLNALRDSKNVNGSVLLMEDDRPIRALVASLKR